MATVYTDVMIDLTEQIFPCIARDCLCRKAKMADRVITRAYDDALRPAGLRITQFTLLVAVGYGMPSSIRELADWLAMERTTLTRNLKLLEKEGLLKTRQGVHHKSRMTELTPSGKARLELAYPLWQSVQDIYRNGLGDEGWPATHDVLSKLTAVGQLS